MTKKKIIETFYNNAKEYISGYGFVLPKKGLAKLANELITEFEKEKQKAIEDVFYDINSDELRENYWDYLDMQDESVVSVEQMKIAAKLEAYEEVFDALKKLAKEYGVEL